MDGSVVKLQIVRLPVFSPTAEQNQNSIPSLTVGFSRFVLFFGDFFSRGSQPTQVTRVADVSVQVKRFGPRYRFGPCASLL